jgi:hypothetical protein
LSLHLPLLLHALSGKVKCSFAAFALSWSNLHQLRAVFAWRVIVEQIELSNSLTEEVSEHDPRFLVPVSILPDYIQTPQRR